ncbi:MAG: GNAT family N-acetyltransferase [Thermotogota bacterium]
MEFRNLKKDEIEKIKEINRDERVHKVYYHENGKLVLRNEDYGATNEWWQQEEVPHIIPRIKKIFDNNGLVYGAFNKGKLVGISAVENRFLKDHNELMNLDVLYVTSKIRGKRIGSRLLKKAKDFAKSKGAKGLYISATPSKHTVNFYFKNGAKLVDDTNDRLFKREPEDIHLVLYF